MATPDEPVVTKRKVTCLTVRALGNGEYAETKVEDYVRPDFLDAYVAAARENWQTVEVSDEPDAGPAGYDGPTFVPPNLGVPNAGSYYPPTPGSEAEQAYADVTAQMVADPNITVVEG